MIIGFPAVVSIAAVVDALLFLLGFGEGRKPLVEVTQVLEPLGKFGRIVALFRKLAEALVFSLGCLKRL